MDTSYVTVRKRQSKSCADLSIILNTSYNENNLDTSTLSLPTISLNENDYTKYLSEQIESQRLQLQSAHEEIDKLSIENTELRRIIIQHERSLDLFKKIGFPENSIQNMTSPMIRKIKSAVKTTPTKSESSPSKNMTQILSLEKKIRNLEQELQTANIQIEKLNIQIYNIKNNKTVYSENSTKNLCNVHTETKNIQSPEDRRKKVIIIADQQGRKLRQCLQNLIGEKFLVTCLWKPGAKLHDLFSSNKLELLSLSKEDYIILLGGTNDNNPFELNCNLEIWLSNLNNTNVLVCETPYNKFLNEKKLNFELRFVCNRHDFVTFIHMDFDRYIPHPSFFPIYVSRIILKELLRNEYQAKIKSYMNKMYIKSLLKSNNIENK